MYRSIKILVSPGYERHLLGSETLYLEILQLPYDLECIPFGIYRTAYDVVSPTHHLGKGLVHHDFLFIARHTSRLHSHAHQGRKVLAHEIRRAAREQCLPALTMNHRTAISANGCAVGTGHRFHVGQSFEELISRVTRRFIIPVGIAYGYLLGIIPHILFQYILILRHHHTHQSTDECHACKLDKQQRTLPALLPLGIAAEHLRYGNTRKEPTRQHASHYKQQKHYRQRYPDTLRSQQGGELYNDRVFHKIAEVEHYQRHQQQCRHNDDTRFQQKHAENRATARTAAFMYAYRLGAVAQRGNGNQHIVQRRNEKNGKTKNAHDDTHPLHIIIIAVCITDGLHKSRVTVLFLIFCRAIFVYHGINTRIDNRFVGTGTETDKLYPTVSPAPRVVIPVAAPQGRHRDNRFRIDCGVLRQIGIDSLHRQVKLMVIIKRFPYGILLTEHFPCKAFTQENNILLHQVLFGIPVQDVDAHSTEEQRIGCNLPVIKTHASIVKRSRYHRRAQTYCRLHLFGEILQNSSCHGTAIPLLRLKLLSFHREYRPYLIQVIIILEASVKTLFICHAGEKQNTHRQSQSQRNDLDDIRTASPQQSLNYIIDLFHSVYRLLDIFSCFSYCRKRAKECTNLIINAYCISEEDKGV